MERSLYLGIDSGLTNIKISIFDDKGNSLFSVSRKTFLDGNTVPTKKLWQNVLDCLVSGRESGLYPFVKGVSVSGHGNGLYCFSNGAPMETGYSSMFQGELPNETPFAITLQQAWAGQPLSILKYLKSKPDIYKKIDKICFCKDFIRFMLTGNLYTEITDASAGGILDNTSFKPSDELFNAYDLLDKKDCIPEIVLPTTICGSLTKEICDLTGLNPDVKVIAGAFDVVSCMIGSGVINDGNAGVISGTWGINSVISNTPAKSQNITQCAGFVDGKYICIDSAPTSSVNLEWFLKNVHNFSYDEVNEIAKDAHTSITYLPYIYPPMDEPYRKASFVGLSANNEKEEFLKAVLCGIAFEHRRNIEKLRSANLSVESIILTGGASNSDNLCQLFSDVLQIPVTINEEKESGALGCAVLSSVALNKYPSILDAVNVMVKGKKTYLPKDNYEKEYAKFIKILGV